MGAEEVIAKLTLDIELGLLPEGVALSSIPEPARSRLREAAARLAASIAKFAKMPVPFSNGIGKGITKVVGLSGVGTVIFAYQAFAEWYKALKGFGSKADAQQKLNGLEDLLLQQLRDVKSRYAQPINPNDAKSPTEVPQEKRPQYLGEVEIIRALHDLYKHLLLAEMQTIQTQLSSNWLVSSNSPCVRRRPRPRNPSPESRKSLPRSRPHWSRPPWRRPARQP